jgi:hypothetical protein
MAPFVFQRVICFSFPGARPHWLRHAKWKLSRTRRGPAPAARARATPARRAPGPGPPPAVAHVSGPAPAARRATAMPGHGPRTTRRPAGWTTTANGPTTAARDPAPARRARNARANGAARGTSNRSRGERHRAADRKTPTRATASRLIHGGHAHDFMRGRCTHLNNGTHQNNDQICSLDGHQNANMAQANTPVVRHGPGGAVTADATAHNYNVSRRTAIRIYGMASSAGSTLPASCHAGISSHAEHHEAHIHHRA